MEIDPPLSLTFINYNILLIDVLIEHDNENNVPLNEIDRSLVALIIAY